jgi:hypothetical protein
MVPGQHAQLKAHTPACITACPAKTHCDGFLKQQKQRLPRRLAMGFAQQQQQQQQQLLLQ